MKLLMVLLGDAMKASSRVRGYWVADALRDRGHTIEIRHADRKLDYLGLIAATLRSDAVILQKKYGRYDVLFARLCRLLCKPLYFDIDDAPSRTGSSPTMARARRIMALGRGVIAGSRNLAVLARKSQPTVHLIPTGILLHRYRPKLHRDDRPLCVGWIGNGSHYADDLVDILVDPLARVARRHEIRFRIVGACGEKRLSEAFGDIPGLTLDLVDQVAWSDAEAVAEAIAPFDIGVFPLYPGPFNDYKCAFKALEYMASALPVVASDVGANREIVEDGKTGFLCRSPADWERALGKLASDVGLRKKFGEAGRARAATHFSVTRIAERIEAALLTDHLGNHRS